MKRITPLQIVLELACLVVLVLQLLLFEHSPSNSLFSLFVSIFIGLVAFLPKLLAKDGDAVLLKVASATYTMKICLKLELLLIVYAITQFQVAKLSIPFWLEVLALGVPVVTLIGYYLQTKKYNREG